VGSNANSYSCSNPTNCTSYAGKFSISDRTGSTTDCSTFSGNCNNPATYTAVRFCLRNSSWTSYGLWSKVGFDCKTSYCSCYHSSGSGPSDANYCRCSSDTSAELTEAANSNTGVYSSAGSVCTAVWASSFLWTSSTTSLHANFRSGCNTPSDESVYDSSAVSYLQCCGIHCPTNCTWPVSRNYDGLWRYCRCSVYCSGGGRNPGAANGHAVGADDSSSTSSFNLRATASRYYNPTTSKGEYRSDPKYLRYCSINHFDYPERERIHYESAVYSSQQQRSYSTNTTSNRIRTEAREPNHSYNHEFH